MKNIIISILLVSAMALSGCASTYEAQRGIRIGMSGFILGASATGAAAAYQGSNPEYRNSTIPIITTGSVIAIAGIIAVIASKAELEQIESREFEIE